MEEFLSHIFELALLPITSQTLLVEIPGAFAYIYGCVSLLFLIIRRI